VVPEGGRAPIWRAAALEASAASAGVARQWLACAFRRFASLFSAHDLVRKPDAAFRDHAFAGGESFSGVVAKQNSDAKTRREDDFVFRHCQAQGAQRRLRAKRPGNPCGMAGLP
jgi:hypothetical protein